MICLETQPLNIITDFQFVAAFEQQPSLPQNFSQATSNTSKLYI